MKKKACWTLVLVIMVAVAPLWALGQEGATLLIEADMDARIRVDGELVATLKAGELKKVPVSMGQHVVEAVSESKAEVEPHRVADDL